MQHYFLFLDHAKNKKYIDRQGDRELNQRLKIDWLKLKRCHISPMCQNNFWFSEY